MMFHPSSEGWLITPHLGQLTVQRETCQGWFDAWKQNMALSSLDESEATAWEPFLPLCHRVCWKWLAASFLAPKDRIGPTYILYMPIQHPEATNAMWPRCPNTIARKFMLGGWDLRCTDFSNDIQICPCDSIRLLFVFPIHDMPSLRHPNAHQRRLIFAYGNLQGSPGDGNGVIPWRSGLDGEKQHSQNPGSRQQQQRQTPEWFGMSWFWLWDWNRCVAVWKLAACSRWARWDGAFSPLVQ
jgi:hypothetical protein